MALRCTYTRFLIPDPNRPGHPRLIHRLVPVSTPKTGSSTEPAAPIGSRHNHNPGSAVAVTPAKSMVGRRFTWRCVLIPEPNQPDYPRLILQKVPVSKRKTGSSTRCDAESSGAPSPSSNSSPLFSTSSSSSSSWGSSGRTPSGSPQRQGKKRSPGPLGESLRVSPVQPSRVPIKPPAIGPSEYEKV